MLFLTQLRDEPDLHLSQVQREVFAGWTRQAELLSDNAVHPVMSVSGKTDLVQDVLTDCSVVASLCATMARTERGHEHLPLTYPRKDGRTKPQPSSSGKYIFLFYFNGCSRKVVIDNRLPSSKTSRSLHVADRNHPGFLWPALVEKAYLKVRGGYDFPGSNSGTDLWVLTGWIPEQVFLHREDVTCGQIWRRLVKAFHYGDVLLTAGTGKLSETEQKGLGLASEHDYAILDMSESNGRRQFLVKNPWADSDHGQGRGLSTPDQKEASSLTPGTFWVGCETMFQNFESLYLNWNPGIFKYREDIHFTWDLSSQRGTTGCFVKNPQFSLSAHEGGTVWLLLGKHFRSKGRLGSSSDSLQKEILGFISIYVFDADGSRVSLTDGALHRGPYVDSPNTLMRLDMLPRTSYTVVISEESLPAVKQNFTLSTLSTERAEIVPAKDKYNRTTKVEGTWTRATAGGNAQSARYQRNPQFCLNIFQYTDVSILLECPDGELATHVKLFWSKGKRITTLRNRDIIQDSGDYRRGCSLAEKKNLAPGMYTIVCSTFAPDQLGKFTLWVWSSQSCEVNPLLPEEAGRRVVLSDIGILPPGTDRMLASLQVPRLSRVKLILRSRQSKIGSRSVAPSPVLMTVELGQGPYKQILATSEEGVHSDAVGGIRIDDFDLEPRLEERGGVWIVIERIGGPGGQVEDHFDVEALSDQRLEIGGWIVEG